MDDPAPQALSGMGKTDIESGRNVMTDGHEWDLIERIRRRAASSGEVLLGIGDDAAALAVGKCRESILVTTDVLMEGVHFDLNRTTPELVGRKALAVNLSDIAAMAGRPTAAFVGLVLPRGRGAVFADRLMEGLFVLAAEFDVTVAGGDTNIWNAPAVISVTLLGEPTGRGPVTRSGAQPGDWLMVTGPLGGSQAGRHLTFTPRVREAAHLNTTIDVHAMIDLSDGLAADVRHLLAESGVGAVLDPATIPIHPDVDADLSVEERREHALSDGEDFELLFAVDPATGEQLLTHSPFEAPLTRIGCVTREPGCWLQTDTDQRVPLESTGWEHRFTES